MITQNGLNFLKGILSKSKVAEEKMTNYLGVSDFDLDFTAKGSIVSYLTDTSSYDMYIKYPTVYPLSMGVLGQFQSISYNYPYRTVVDGNTITSYQLATQYRPIVTQDINYTNSIYYKGAHEHVFTIRPNMANFTTLDSCYNIDGSYYRYFYPYTYYPYTSTSINKESFEYIDDICPIGTSGDNTEYITLSFPPAFFNPDLINVDLRQLTGDYNTSILFNLGYSGDTESIDDYDLSSPVYDKKLCINRIEIKSVENGLEFTAKFVNKEAESITVREFGIYYAARNSSNYPKLRLSDKINSGTYSLGSIYNGYDTNTMYIADLGFIAPLTAPYLIVRKVLPQAVTIPPDGVATFKYTIDLSEMKAQENITYSEE